MPQAGAAIAAWVWSGTMVSAGTIAATAAVANFAIAYGFSSLAARLQAKGLNNDARFQTREQLIRSATQPKDIVYGQAWIGGAVLYANQRHTPSSKDNFEFYIGVVHTGHESEDIVDLMFDNDTIGAANIDWGTGVIDGGKYGINSGGVYAVQIEKKLGTSSQTASSLLNGAFSSDWTSAHRARGYTCTFYKFTFFSQTQDLFNGGAPANIKVLCKGRKVYDSRLDSTNGGTGAHRVDDPTTWEWSDNTILCAVDFKRFFARNKIPGSRVDWASVAANADICDELVDIPGPSTEKRYTTNGAVSLGASDAQNLSDLLSSCAGKPVIVNGKWRFLAGAYQTPDVVLTEADCIGDVTVTSSSGRRERYNSVKATYFSASSYGQEVDSIPMADAGFLSRDNGEDIPKTIALPMVNEENPAQRISFKHLQQSDQQTTVIVPLKFTGYRLTPGTYCEFTHASHGFSSQPMRCISWRPGGSEAPIVAVLKIDDPGAWADPEIADYSTRSATGVITPGTVGVPPATSLTATAEVGANRVKWTLPTTALIDFVRVFASASSAWAGASLIYEGTATEFRHKIETQRWYWIRTVRNGVESDREPNSDTSSITATPLGYSGFTNVVPDSYSDLESVSIDDFTPDTPAKWSINTTYAYIGGKSLRYNSSSSAQEAIRFVRGLRDNMVIPPNRRWIIIAGFRPDQNATGNDVDHQFVALNTGALSVASNIVNFANNDAWALGAFEIDLTAQSTTVMHLAYRLTLGGTPIGAVQFNIDAIEMIDVTNTPEVTSSNAVALLPHFVPGSGGREPRPDAGVSAQSLGAVGDGVADDTDALERIVDALASGGEAYFAPGGNYRIYPTGSLSGSHVLCAFSDVDGITLDGRGATITVEDTFTGSEHLYLFQFFRCKNVTVRNFTFLCTPRATVTDGGMRPVYFNDACENIIFENIVQVGGQFCFDTDRNLATQDETQKCRKIVLQNIDCTQVGYTISCQNSGDDLFARNIRSKGGGRTYFPYGVRNHDVEVQVIDNKFIACLLRVYGNDTTSNYLENIKLRVRGSGTPGTAQVARVSLIPMYYDTPDLPCTMRNIDINVDEDYENTADYFIVGLGKEANDAGPDSTDRGHIWERIVISGSIRGRTIAGNNLVICSPTGSTGTFGTGEIIRDLVLRDFVADGAQGALAIDYAPFDYFAYENVTLPGVSSSNAPRFGVSYRNTILGGNAISDAIDSIQTLTGAGAVDLTHRTTHLVTTGANALTLANGFEGQRKTIIHKTDGGDGTLTPTTFAGNPSATITFNDAGDTAELLFTNGAWHWLGGSATVA